MDTAIADGALQPADITGGTNVTVTATTDGVTIDASGGGGGTDDQTAAEVPVTATGFAGNLSGTDTDVQTALATIDGFTLGGGGGGAGTSEQRVESVSFADVDDITSTPETLTLIATTPIAVEFGDGTAEMLTGTGGETTFAITDSRAFTCFEFEAIYPADGDRATPFVEIQQDSDDTVIGRSTNTYMPRRTGSPEDGLIVVLDGIVSVPTDAIAVKAVLGNVYNQNSLDADGGKLKLVRINSGLRGATGPGGAAGSAGAAGGWRTVRRARTRPVRRGSGGAYRSGRACGRGRHGRYHGGNDRGQQRAFRRHGLRAADGDLEFDPDNLATHTVRRQRRFVRPGGRFGHGQPARQYHVPESSRGHGGRWDRRGQRRALAS